MKLLPFIAVFLLSLLAWAIAPKPRVAGPAPLTGSRWRHYNGNTYVVHCVANLYSRNAKYPPTVVYIGEHNARYWSRPLADWHRSMTEIKP